MGLHEGMPIRDGTERNNVLLHRSRRSHEHSKSNHSERTAGQGIHSLQITPPLFKILQILRLVNDGFNLQAHSTWNMKLNVQSAAEKPKIC